MVSASGEPARFWLDPTVTLRNQTEAAAFVSGVRSGIGRVELLGYRVDEEAFGPTLLTLCRP